MKLLLPSLALALTASVSTLPAQNRVDTFTYPNGTRVFGWTQQWNSWKILNGRLIPTSGRTFHYITNDAIKNVKDCVVDIEVIYPKNTSLHYGGVVARHPGGTGEKGLVMTKLQDNSSVGTGSFNRVYLYERPGGSTSLAVPKPTKRAVVRMFVKGKTAWFEIDTDMDGIFDMRSTVRTFSNTTTKTSGLVGACGYNGAEMDNWKFYEGILSAPTSAKAKIGTSYTMTFDAPLNGSTTPRPTPWIGLLSGGNKGIPLTNGFWIPLSLDALLVNSLGFGWTGVLTTKKPSANMTLAIPNDTSFVGLKLWAAAFTFGASRPGAWGAVSNAHGFMITK